MRDSASSETTHPTSTIQSPSGLPNVLNVANHSHSEQVNSVFEELVPRVVSAWFRRQRKWFPLKVPLMFQSRYDTL